jgi:exopolysaccharide production protein ExoQ
MLITRERSVKLYLMYVICMTSEVFTTIFSGGGASSSGGKATFLHSDNSNPILLCFTALFVGWTVILALPIRRQIITRLISVPWYTAIYLLAALSITWSVMPTATFRYSIYLWAYMISGVICSIYLDTAETITTVANTLCLTAFLSIPAQYHYPQDGIAPGWTGLYGEKNHLGIGMTIAIIALLLPRTKWNLIRVGKVALCAALLFLSQSGTAIVCALFCAIVLVCLRAPQRLRRLVLALVSGSAVIAFMLIPDILDRLLAVGGKDPTLTGRNVIWWFTIQQWARRPVLGWGFSAFWNSQDALIQQHLGWNPSYSHNGFLETALTLGIVGEVLIVALLAGAILLALRVIRCKSELAGAWLLLSLTILILHDITEVDFLVSDPLWVVFGLSFFSAVAVRREATVLASRHEVSVVPLVFGQISTG